MTANSLGMTEPLRAGFLTRCVYSLALLAFIPSAISGGSGWIALALGGGVVAGVGRTGFLIIVSLVFFRIYQVLRYPAALDARPPNIFGKFLRYTGWLAMFAGVAAGAGLFLVKPITLALFKTAGDAGIGYFVVGLWLVLLANLGWLGCVVFELSRVSGSPLTIEVASKPWSKRIQDFSVLGAFLATTLSTPFLLRQAVGVPCDESNLARCVSTTGEARGNEINWNEEVRLSTDENIVVKRGEIRRYVREPLQKGDWLFQEAWIEWELPAFGRFRWDTTLRPWLLDRASNGTWYLIGMKGSYSSESEYGIHHPHGRGALFVPFQFRNNRWERILGTDLPAEFQKPNLLVYGELVFEPHPNATYWDGVTHRRRPQEREFSSGDLLDLARKERVNVPSHLDSEPRFKLAQQWIDNGERYKSECTVGGACGPQCAQKGGRCEVIKRMGLDERIGRLPVQMTESR